MAGGMFGKTRQQLLYSPEEKAHFAGSRAIEKYLSRKATASQGTANTYKSSLSAFAQYIYREHRIEVDRIIVKFKANKESAYDALADFASFLQKRKGEFTLTSNVVVHMVKVAMRFLRFSGVPLASEEFREMVSLPRKEKIAKVGIGKKDVVRLLNGADLQLKTFIMAEAVFGARPLEMCAVRNRDVDLAAGTVTFRAKYSKMRVERKRYLTKELTTAIQVWYKHKYRAHRTTLSDGSRAYVEPEPKPDELLFATWSPTLIPAPRSLYNEIQRKFSAMVDRMGMGEWQDGNRRRDITLYSFRRFAKTTISDLGFADFSEYWIGHSASVYWSKPEKDILALFRRVEPYLTFVDADSLEASSADVTQKLEAQEQRHKDAMAALKEQLSQEIQALKSALIVMRTLNPDVIKTEMSLAIGE